MGASGKEECHPAPLPAKPATTTTAASAITFAAVTRFCAQRPAVTPTRFTPVKSAIRATPRAGTLPVGQARSRARYSPPTVPTAAMAAQ